MRRALPLLTVLLLTTPLLAAEPPATLTIHTDQPTRPVSPVLYGVFFEDINYAADGGLYAELIQNRSFEFKGKDARFAWTTDDARGKYTVESDQPIHPNNPHYLRVTASDNTPLPLTNAGFDGIPLKAGQKYLFSAFARSADRAGKLAVRLTADGQTLAEADLPNPGPAWSKITTTLTPSADANSAALTLLITGPGTTDLDMVSLFPQATFKNRPNGLRPDLAQLVGDMKPSFVRFPGGCIVEGKDLANAYRWKDTVGPVEHRKMNWNRWQDAIREKPAPQYYQTYGLGFFEFFQYCEDIGATPLPIVNCGMACQFQSKQLVPLDQLDPFVQDALDLIEFATGPADSTWGKVRADMGHPKPFELKYLGVGNEQWGEEYLERYKIFHDALKAKYSQIRLVTTAGASPSGQWFDRAWKYFRDQPAELVDEHYYMPPKWFLDNVGRYDHYPRTGPRVFAGEFAAHTAKKQNNLEAALAEAAFMTGLERNGDVVEMASYAPLLAKHGRTQWVPDLIWFDNTRAYGTPSYFVQKLFGTHRVSETYATTVTDKRLFTVAGKDNATGDLVVKVVNTAAEPLTATLAGAPAGTRRVTVLAGKSPADANTLDQPTTVIPTADNLENVTPATATLAPHSLTILRFPAAR